MLPPEPGGAATASIGSSRPWSSEALHPAPTDPTASAEDRPIDVVRAATDLRAIVARMATPQPAGGTTTVALPAGASDARPAEVLVRGGAAVTIGRPLAILDTVPRPEAAPSRAEALLAAEAELERVRATLAANRDIAEASVAAARARAERATAAHRRTEALAASRRPAPRSTRAARTGSFPSASRDRRVRGSYERRAIWVRTPTPSSRAERSSATQANGEEQDDGCRPAVGDGAQRLEDVEAGQARHAMVEQDEVVGPAAQELGADPQDRLVTVDDASCSKRHAARSSAGMRRLQALSSTTRTRLPTTSMEAGRGHVRTDGRHDPIGERSLRSAVPVSADAMPERRSRPDPEVPRDCTAPGS